jgi:hypothetical protein
LIVYYVDKTTSDVDESGDFEVTFLRKSSKRENYFIYPNVADTASVNKSNIQMLLSLPTPSSTKRQPNIVKFNIDFYGLNRR